MGEPNLQNPAELAQFFHETYETLGPSFGYETRLETRAFDPSSPNGKLMVAVCSIVLRTLPAAPMGVNGLRVTGPNSDGEYWLHLKDGVNDLGMNLGADHGIIGGKLLAKAVAIPAAPMGVKPLEIENAVWSAMLWAADNNVGFNAALEYDPLGNSYAQIECRSAARRILAALTPQPAPTLSDAVELPEVRALIEALKDAASDLEYVRYHYGELHGVGFDRVRDASDAALAALKTKGGA